MTPESFSNYVKKAPWRFAKSVPNWPHFYIVEQDLPDSESYRMARSFIQDCGRDGTFYDIQVRYYDLDGWTYWASPIKEPTMQQYMLNRCKSEFSYDTLNAKGEIPQEGFNQATLNLESVLNDPDFNALRKSNTGHEFTVFDVLGTADYEIRHSNVLAWLLTPFENHGQGSSFLKILWEHIHLSLDCPPPPLTLDAGIHVDREGSAESERIDLLLKSNDTSWLIVIENKLFSPETGDQLDRYYTYVEERYASVPNRYYFYLTPNGISADKASDASVWRPFSYELIRASIRTFLQQHRLGERIEDFLRQYLEHIERNVLKDVGRTERMRNVLRRHPKTFHAFEQLLTIAPEQMHCDDLTLNLLKSILAVQQNVEAELFGFTKQMMREHGYKRYSGLGNWVTINIPGLNHYLVEKGLLPEKSSSPFLLFFVSSPYAYFVEIVIYKNSPIYSKVKHKLSLYSNERPPNNRGDEHLTQVVFHKTIIDAESIIHKSIAEQKEHIARYFAEELKTDLEEGYRQLVNQMQL